MAPLLVVGPSGYPTLQAALDAAVAGDTIQIEAGDYTETVTVDVDVTFEAQGVVTLHPEVANDGVFEIDGAAAVTVRGVVIDGLDGGRAALVVSGALVLDGVTVRNTTASAHGGAIQASPNPANAVALLDSTFTTSSATSAGKNGGFVAILGGDLTVRGTTFVDGDAAGDGGAVHFVGAGTVVIEDSHFEGCAAAKHGGALNLAGGTVEIRRTTFTDNDGEAERGGGALYAEGTASLAVEDCTFQGNEGANEGGGAIHQRDGTATYVRDVFCSNQAGTFGGALRLHSGTATVENGVFVENGAATDGGAIWVRAGASLELVNASVVTGAATDGDGHAIYVEGSTVEVADTFVAHHGTGAFAVYAGLAGTTTRTSLYEANAGGNWSGEVAADATVITTLASGVPAPAPGSCDRFDLLPPPKSPLYGNGSYGGDIGAFGGPNAWTDDDGDGHWSHLTDCDDADPATYEGADEQVGDEVDEDCDGSETCFEDVDGDGSGDPGTAVAGDDVDCDDAGEADNDEESCPGFDDDADADLDGAPDGCDACPGYDDRADGDGDGIPDGCDTWTPTDTATPSAPDRAPQDPSAHPAGSGCGCAGLRGPSAGPLVALLLLRRRR